MRTFKRGLQRRDSFQQIRKSWDLKTMIVCKLRQNANETGTLCKKREIREARRHTAWRPYDSPAYREIQRNKLLHRLEDTHLVATSKTRRAPMCTIPCPSCWPSLVPLSRKTCYSECTSSGKIYWLPPTNSGWRLCFRFLFRNTGEKWTIAVAICTLWKTSLFKMETTMCPLVFRPERLFIDKVWTLLTNSSIELRDHSSCRERSYTQPHPTIRRCSYKVTSSHISPEHSLIKSTIPQWYSLDIWIRTKKNPMGFHRTSRNFPLRKFPFPWENYLAPIFQCTDGLASSCWWTVIRQN